jgi:hypothetical protein
MQIVRTFFYLLVAANLVLSLFTGLSLAGMQAPWQPTGEGERLHRQLAAEKINVLSNNPAALASAPAEIASATAAQAASAPAATVEPDAAVCAAFKGLSAEEISQINTLAAPRGDTLKLQSNGASASSWWVNIPPGGGKDGAIKRGETLTKAGITDYIIVREAGPNQFAISLGLFRNEEAAHRLIDQLQKKNIKTARITVRDSSSGAGRVELRGAARIVQPLVDEILASIKVAQRDNCQPR